MTDESKPPTRMGKQELIDALLASGYTKEQLSDDKGKSFSRIVLLEKFQDHQQGEEGLAVLSEVKEVQEDNDIGIPMKLDDKEGQEDVCVPKLEPEPLKPPTPNDPGWTQFVLGLFMEDEMDGKNPRVEGLRRIAGELVGELIEEGCDLVAAPEDNNRFRACAKAWGVFVTREGVTKRFEALADADSTNCQEDYATYLVAMADTRAKGRMFRNALCLRRVVAAEEVSKTMAIASDIQEGGAIHTGQISMISLMSSRHDFNIEEVLNNLDIKYKINEQTGKVNLKLLSYEDALAATKSMREMVEEKENK